jgi:hypothetical protein
MKRKIYSKNNLPPKTNKEFKEQSKTEQKWLAEVNINKIIEKYNITGAIPQQAENPIYIDLTAYPNDIAEMEQRVENAKEYFNSLHSSIRDKFDLDFNKFITAVNNKDERLYKLNILEQKKEKQNEQVSETNTILENDSADIT